MTKALSLPGAEQRGRLLPFVIAPSIVLDRQKKMLYTPARHSEFIFNDVRLRGEIFSICDRQALC
jgi:hypothetical protein